jgi:hypothetical protein
MNHANLLVYPLPNSRGIDHNQTSNTGIIQLFITTFKYMFNICVQTAKPPLISVLCVHPAAHIKDINQAFVLSCFTFTENEIVGFLKELLFAEQERKLVTAMEGYTAEHPGYFHPAAFVPEFAVWFVFGGTLDYHSLLPL